MIITLFLHTHTRPALHIRDDFTVEIFFFLILIEIYPQGRGVCMIERTGHGHTRKKRVGVVIPHIFEVLKGWLQAIVEGQPKLNVKKYLSMDFEKQVHLR